MENERDLTMYLEIRNLYKRFNYMLDFNDEGVTILTGPNGYAKSTILHCIHALNNSDIYFFVNLEFEKIKVTYKERSLTIEKRDDILYINNHSYRYKYDSINLFRDRGVNREVQLISEDNETKEKDLQEMASVTEYIKLIKEQRLLREEMVFRVNGRERARRKEYEKAIDEIPKKLSRYIDKIASRYTEVATKLDSTFPYRILKNEINSKLDKKKFNDLYTNMNKKIEMLNKMGISEKNENKILEFNEEDAKVFEIFFNDFDSKYEVYEPLLNKLSLFLDIINKRFTFKEVQIAENHQLIVIDKKTREQIPLSGLSSGEQEVIILFYSLLFETVEKTMVLIDEPEISLHIAWQMMFIDDLKKIVKLNKLCAVVATHSPDIIGGNRNIQIDLGEMYINGFNHEGTC